MSKSSDGMLAFIAGVAAGAAAVFFADEKNRLAARDAVLSAGQKVKEVAADPKASLQAASDVVTEAAEDVKDKAARATKAAKKELAKPAKK